MKVRQCRCMHENYYYDAKLMQSEIILLINTFKKFPESS